MMFLARAAKISSRRPRGFSLVEVLVAMMVVSSLILGLTLMLRHVGRSLAAVWAQGEPAAASDAVETFVRNLVGTADRIGGTRQRLDVIGPLPQALGAGGFGRVSLSAGAGGLSLRFSEAKPSGGFGPVSTTFLDHVAVGVAFAYLELPAAAADAGPRAGRSRMPVWKQKPETGEVLAVQALLTMAGPTGPITRLIVAPVNVTRPLSGKQDLEGPR